MSRYRTLVLIVFLTIFIGCSSQPKTSSKRSPVSSWSNVGPGASNFIVPPNWYLKTESVKGTYGVYISKENIDVEGKYLTGFTLNYIKDVPLKIGEPPSNYAKGMLFRLALLSKSVGKSWDKTVGPLKYYGARMKDRTTTTEYIFVANDETGSVFMIVFESPNSEWAEAWKIGKKIIDGTKLDSKI